MSSLELQLPDEFATPQEIDSSDIELIPGIVVPRDPSAPYSLTGGKAACLKSELSIRTTLTLQTPPDTESEALSS